MSVMETVWIYAKNTKHILYDEQAQIKSIDNRINKNQDL